MKVKSILTKRNLVVLVFFSLLVATIFTVVRIIFAPAVAPVGSENIRIKSDYVLMLLQSIVGVLVIVLPTIGLKKKDIDIMIPTKFFFIYAIFLYCAIYLGEVRSIYFLVLHWDNILIRLVMLCSVL